MTIDRVSARSFPVKIYPITQDYEITQHLLGTGINGKVVRCVHKQTGRICALKVCKRNSSEFISISRYWLKLTNAAQIVFQIANAIYWLHSRNIAHRDLKPENLLFESDAPDATLKLTDFGFAKEISGFLKTPCFSCYYVAPEVLSSAAYDQQCDMWSLGVITYILSGGDNFSPGMKDRIRTGCYTFPSDEWKDVSDEAKDLINKLLIVEPRERLTIEGVMQHPWIVQHQRVPETPLHTLNVLSCEKMNWNEVQVRKRLFAHMLCFFRSFIQFHTSKFPCLGYLFFKLKI
ncbi:unnamed protein product [Hymenolepis diminuta]|uniref:Protein kinase domain-containing protein n=1 Tax=Hymenolepis diminuta TaxID=6216 RepID=A0A0R3SYL1_HYMDI|nr:unnamed protein product [Hymenolepis diminuta]